MIRVLGVAALLLGLPATVPAAPTSHERKVARAHYEKAVNHFNAGEYVPAADEFQAVYKIVPQPVLLYDAAQAYRLAADTPKALEFYQAYMKAAPPEAAQRSEV